MNWPSNKPIQVKVKPRRPTHLTARRGKPCRRTIRARTRIFRGTKCWRTWYLQGPRCSCWSRAWKISPRLDKKMWKSSRTCLIISMLNYTKSRESKMARQALMSQRICKFRMIVEKQWIKKPRSKAKTCSILSTKMIVKRWTKSKTNFKPWSSPNK